MTTREKIIVGMMCVTIAYGAYELLSSGPAKKRPAKVAINSPNELQKLVTDLSKQLSGKGTGLDIPYIAGLASADWTKDPFIHSAQPLQKTLAAPSSQEKPITRNQNIPIFNYSGFLEIGPVKLAIINGQEYAEGDALGTTGYYVRSISARHVVVGKIKGSDIIRLALQEIAD